MFSPRKRAMAAKSNEPRATPYKVVLVEDEVVAREGIRETVNWVACGFVFAGDASDGEAAIPVIEQVQPDVLITDIRMPFMDGLQLCRIVRERYPQTHILILSGYDEFSYAQTAIQLGVVEYLLKPVSARDLERALLRMKALLDRDRAESAGRNALQQRVQESLALQREELLRRLCLGDVDAYEALDQSQEIGLAISARAYVILMAHVHSAEHLDPRRAQAVQSRIIELCAGVDGVHTFRKDFEEVVALVRANDELEALSISALLATRMQEAALGEDGVVVLVVSGDVRKRLSDVPHSFAAAIAAMDAARPLDVATEPPPSTREAVAPPPGGGPRPNRRALERFLRLGNMSEFDDFFATYVGELENAILAARLYREYLVMDVAMAAAGFVEELGGIPGEVVPEVERAPLLVDELRTSADVRRLARTLFQRVLDYRDFVVKRRHLQLIHRVREYLECEFAQPDLVLHTVAAEVGLSPSHLSALFSRETGETFKAYLTRLRIEHAQTLLRSTSLPVAEVSLQAGYNDPHYFSAAFKRATGVSPRDYRDAVHT